MTASSRPTSNTRRSLALTGLVAFTVTLLVGAGCGGGGGNSLPEFSSLFLSYVYRLNPTELEPFTASVGDSAPLLAFGRTAGGENWTLTDRVTWQVSDPSVATVSGSGLLQALQAGTVEITATREGLVSDQLTVLVTAVGPRPTADYYPFGRGHYWTYTGTPVTPHGVRAQADTTQTVSTQRQVVIAGKVWWEVELAGTNPEDPPGAMWLRHDDRGLLEYVGGATGEQYRLREPLVAGNRWSDPADPEHNWEILSTTATVSVPAGTYHNCIQVRERWVTLGGVPYDSLAWFAPGVGLVRNLVSYEEGGQPVQQEQRLVEFQAGMP